jgi:hypothetical protein
MRIYITGSARSGTTLLGRLFYAFEDVTVIDAEIELEYFVQASGIETEHYSGKRSVATIFSNDLNDGALRQQEMMIKSNDIKIVNIMRDGRDVVHKPEKGTQCTPQRWIACMDQVDKYGYLIDCNIYYEDLVKNPGDEMGRVILELGLVPHTSWSEYPDFVPGKAFETQSTQGLPLYGPRTIEPSKHDPNFYKTLPMGKAEYDSFERWLDIYDHRDL